ncbi:hypothetical protein MMC10_011417 [Thelotrema lepadinum]|nr:hypothetical protein [Thelotrema lepadinum]
MLSKNLFLTALVSAAAATPVIKEVRDASPVVAALAPRQSTTPSTLRYTVYFASTQCEFTSSTETINAGDCINVGGAESFSFDTFQNGNDHPSGTTCQLEIFSATGCSGTAATVIPASSVTISDTCSSASGESALLSC